MSAKNNDVYSMLEKLVSCKSITPYDDGCQSIISDFLKKFGFEINIIEKSGVSNLIATYGNKSPRLAFVGHTDVVPIGIEPMTLRLTVARSNQLSYGSKYN